MPMVTLHKMGEGNVYHLHVLDQGADPGYGRPEGPGGRPGQGLPGGGGRPDQGLPGSGAHPGGRPPGMGGGGIPDHELPDHPPPQVAPGWTLVLIRHGAMGKWEYAAIAPGSPPPRPLPPQGGGRPDQGLPGQQPHPDQGLPGQGGPNYPTTGPVPPYPTTGPVPPPQGGQPPVPPQPTPAPQAR